MDRTWMYGARTTDAYRDGLRGFMVVAEAHMLREGELTRVVHARTVVT